MIIEIATTDYTTTQLAVEGGADRIELCAALAEGGTTASEGTIRRCREKFEVEIFPIIRPRGGDFLYTEEEFEIMLYDAQRCKQLGCDGVVIGLLNKEGSIDLRRTSILVETVYPLEVTFHRAFDRCKDPFEALEQLVEIGCQRILTSGQKRTAPDGIELLADLVKAANERIIIMPGSGVRKENIKELADKTGAREFHSSLRSKKKSAMEFRHPALEELDYQNPGISAEDIREMKKC